MSFRSATHGSGLSPSTPQRAGAARPRTPTARSGRVASGTPQSARRRPGVSAGGGCTQRVHSADAQRRMDDSDCSQRTPGTPTASFRSATAGARTPGAENVVAAVRVRGFLHREQERSDELCIRMRHHTCEISYPGRGRFPFTFDHCFWSMREFEGISDLPYAGQAEVYDTLGRPVVENAMAGFNAAVIAYGQTGSGKSYSIFGPPDSLGTEQEGLIPRMCKDLFERVKEPKPGVTWKISASMIEIYMEKIYDLLSDRNQLTIRGDLQRGFTVLGRKQREVKNYSHIEDLLQCGEMKRTVAQTALNERSSRAHTLFELEIRHISEERTWASKLTLCDLAGSERCKDAKTEVGGKEFNQACQINMSLLCLGKCVESVVQRGSERSTLTEFRNSALTKLLKDSIGGNSKTVILTTISPSQADVHTTMQALRFADRAKQIQLHAVINEDALWKAKNEARQMQHFYQSRIEHLTKEYEFEKQQAELTEQQLQLEVTMARVQAEREKLRVQKQQLMRSKAMSEAERRQFEQRESELQEQLTETHAQHEQLQKRMEELEGLNARNHADSQAIKREKEELEEEICFLQGKIELLRKQHEDQAIAWEDEKAAVAHSHRLEIESLTRSHAHALECKEDHFIDERKQCVEQMMMSVAKLQKDMQAKEERWAEKEESWRRQLREHEEAAATLSAERDRLRAELAESRRAAQGGEEAAARSEALAAELAAKGRECDTLQDQLTTAKWGQEEAAQRIAALHRELGAAASQHADAQQELRAAGAAVGECRAAVGLPRESHGDDVGPADRLSEFAAEAAAARLTEEQQRRAERESTLAEFRQERAEAERLRGQLAAAEAELAAAKDVFARGDGELRAQLGALSQQQRTLGEELAAKRRQLSEQQAVGEARAAELAAVRTEAERREQELEGRREAAEETLRRELDELRAAAEAAAGRHREALGAAEGRAEELAERLRGEEARGEALQAAVAAEAREKQRAVRDALAEAARAQEEGGSALSSLRREHEEAAETAREEHARELAELRERQQEEVNRACRQAAEERRRNRKLEEELRASQERETQGVQNLMQAFQRMCSELHAVGEQARRDTVENKRRVNSFIQGREGRESAGGRPSFGSAGSSRCGRQPLSPMAPPQSDFAASPQLTPPQKFRSRCESRGEKENLPPPSSPM